jgi:hypothetical protein
MPKPIRCPCCGEEISGDYFSADKSRRYFFAALHDTFHNLRPEHLQRWPNEEVLRKHALIAVGWCDVMTVAVGTKSGAQATAHSHRTKDHYCIATVQGGVAMIYTARSMDRTSLPKKQFLEVSQKVFAWIADATGIDPSQSIEGRNAA